MTKAYSYIRFSTPEQAKGDSSRRQEKAAIEYASKAGLDLDTELTFKDLGVSAYHGDNSETGRLGDFLQAVKVGIVEHGSFLLVESLDRISRQTARKAQRVLEDICEAGVNVVTLSDGRIYNQDNLDDPMALIMSLLIFIRANEESSTKSKRLKSAWSNKRAAINSKPLTGLLPGWLHILGDQIQPIPERVEIVKQIFTDYLSGIGAEGIAKKLNTEGVEPWGVGQRLGREWHKSYIQKILNNPAVYGEFTLHTQERVNNKKIRVPQETVEDYFPIVVDKLTYSRAQKLRQSKVLAGRNQSIALRNIFSGVAKCPLCGAVMIRAGKGKYDYLVCAAAKSGKCKYKTIRYDKVETRFINIMRRAIEDMPLVDKRHNEYLKELRSLRKQLATTERIINTLVAAISDKSLTESPKSIIDRIQHLEIEKFSLEQQIKSKASESRTLQPTSVLHQRKSLVAVLERTQLDKSRCNALLNELCDSIIFRDLEHAEANFKNGVVLDMDFSIGGIPYKYRGLNA